MTRDEQYSAFEGLAVATASRVFDNWRKSLEAHGVEKADACQEARIVLLELLPKLDDPQYAQQQRTAYIVKSIRGRLLNWAKAAVRNGDARERPDPPMPDRDGEIDLTAALATLDPTIRRILWAWAEGQNPDEIGLAEGLSARQVSARVKAALPKVKRIMCR